MLPPRIGAEDRKGTKKRTRKRCLEDRDRDRREIGCRDRREIGCGDRIRCGDRIDVGIG